jgi:hypothetical protein
MNTNTSSLNLSLGSVKKIVTTFLHRFHVVIFVIVVLGTLAIVILLLNNTIIMSGQSNGYTPTTNDATFDQATIKKIQDLKTAGQSSSPIDLSGGRTNPFVE